MNTASFSFSKYAVLPCPSHAPSKLIVFYPLFLCFYPFLHQFQQWGSKNRCHMSCTVKFGPQKGNLSEKTGIMYVWEEWRKGMSVYTPGYAQPTFRLVQNKRFGVYNGVFCNLIRVLRVNIKYFTSLSFLDETIFFRQIQACF